MLLCWSLHLLIFCPIVFFFQQSQGDQIFQEAEKNGVQSEKECAKEGSG